MQTIFFTNAFASSGETQRFNSFFEKPERIPSKRKNKNGKNIGKLAFKRTNVKLRTRVVNGKPSSNLFSIYYSKEKDCSLQATDGHETREECLIADGNFQEWTQEPSPMWKCKNFKSYYKVTPIRENIYLSQLL